MSAPSRTDLIQDRAAALELQPAEFRALGHELVDRIADFLGTLRDRPVTPAESPEIVRRALASDRPLPEAGGDPAALLREACDLLFEHSLFNGHPRFFGYITSSAAPLGALADLLASAVNPNVGAWALSPMATEIEAQTVRWLAQFIGYPDTCGGLLLSGGNLANITCFLTARAAKAGWDVRSQGMGSAEAARLCVYASRGTHTWLQKAADITGLGTDAIHWIDPTGSAETMDVAALEARYQRDVQAGFRPFLVVASAGTVSTGAVDPIPALAEFCNQRGLWLHVDGAYGAFAAAVENAPDNLKALRLADSVAVDPHKWLYAPLEAGCVLVRDPKALRDAFSYHPPYYSFDFEITNYFDLGPQNSRGFRALKVWLALQQAGAAGYRSMIEQDMTLSRQLFDLACAHREIEALTQHLSITTLRFVPEELRANVGQPAAEEYLNRLNQQLLEALNSSGQAFASNAVLDGRFALRFCIVNFRTTSNDIEALPGLITRLGSQLHSQLQGAAAR